MTSHLKEDKNDLKSMIILFKAHNALIEYIKKDIENTGFDLNEFAVFEVIYHKEKLTVNEIKEKVLVANSSLTYILDKLEKKDLIKREKSTEDQRISLVSLTNKGINKATAIFPNHYNNLKSIFNNLTKEEQEELNKALKTIGFIARERL